VQTEAPLINPTGRILEMIVPLSYRNFYLGDLSVRLTPQQTVEAPVADLGRAVQELLRPEALQALSEAGGTADHVSLSDLRQAGFDFRFDPAAVGIIFAPTLDQKVEGNISVQARKAVQDSPNAVDPAKLAAFLNLRAATDYIGMSPAGNEGLSAPRLDLEGATSWQGIVVEAETTYEPDDVSIFGRTGQGFKRRGTRLIRDFQEDAIRVSAGDIYPAGAALQSTPDLLGFSIERSYGTLQPGRNIRPTSRRSFRIERPSNVDVEINGVIERRLKLDPGDYNLSDLPIRSGLNEVVLLISDDAGAQERLEFSVFRDGDLLEPGLSEWALSGGILSTFDQGEPDYDGGEYFGTGFYRQGVTENMTAEVHLQGGAHYGLAGVTLLYGSSLGLFALDGAASLVGSKQWGVAAEAYYSPPVWTDAHDSDHAFRFTMRGQSADYIRSIPHAGQNQQFAKPHHERWLDLSTSYRTELPFHVSAFLSAGYGFGFETSDDRIHADAGFSRSFGPELNVGVTGGYSGTYHGKDDDDLSLQLRMHYRPDIETSLGFSYDPAGHQARASYSRRSGRGVGSWHVSGDVSHEAADGDDFDPALSAYTVDGSIHYTGNRGLIGLHQQSRLAGLDAASLDQRTSIRVETAIAFADGAVAFGRPVADGFAIVTPHAGLSGNDITIGREETGITARGDWLGPALIPSVSPYSLNRIEFDVADLPAGYDLGDGLFDLQPDYRSGYALKVGSAYTVTAIGTLLDGRSEPIALLTGLAIEAANPDKTVELFTNRTGRFAAQGLAPGKWILEVASAPPQRFELTIPDDAVGLVRAGTLHPIEGSP
jgi:outer membrane usher protein